jgi:ribosomal protein S13
MKHSSKIAIALILAKGIGRSYAAQYLAMQGISIRTALHHLARGSK